LSPPRTGGHCGPPGCGPDENTTPSTARSDPDLLARIADWISDGALALADLGYEGEPETFTIPFKKPQDGQLTADEQAYNAIHGALRCLGERANSLLKTTYKALRRYRGCPWRLGDIIAAALVLLHHEHRRTT
jgi:DDE superfamily endonuclease